MSTKQVVALIVGVIALVAAITLGILAVVLDLNALSRVRILVTAFMALLAAGPLGRYALTDRST
jgi:hypothetical protein